MKVLEAWKNFNKYFSLWFSFSVKALKFFTVVDGGKNVCCEFYCFSKNCIHESQEFQQRVAETWYTTIQGDKMSWK